MQKDNGTVQDPPTARGFSGRETMHVGARQQTGSGPPAGLEPKDGSVFNLGPTTLLSTGRMSLKKFKGL